MANDGKLGLVFGVALVILIGVFFFRRDVAVPTVGPDATAAPRVLLPAAGPASFTADSNANAAVP